MEAETLLLSLCRRLIDPHARPITTHAGHNGTIALRAATTAGEVIAKLHRGLDRHQQEIHAYTHWTAVLHGRAPQLLAVSDDPPAIVISALPGRPLADTPLPASLETEAHRQAGAILHALHHAAPATTEPDMTGWLAERGEYWLAQAQHLLPADRCAEIRGHMHALRDLGPIPAVPCHLDYTPRNLLCSITDAAQPVRNGDDGSDPHTSAEVNVATFDFEHARYDLAARDLVRVATRVWKNRPDLEEAFLQGYGPLSPLDRRVIQHCSHLDALTGIVRAAHTSAAALTARSGSESA
ncbi:aminoglycoside phosphotransferase family protein [Couchioplanes caeruleus]|uniref:phosphotransferase n=1 Tax=Couchioplanes caeruleus TaxID=56438 RepID=UPI0020BD81EF|nr:aminoglycoside phosphotransferase family protein [Couchioplanes caeruleus]UQU68486.1 aminoglycoside phosphotransferase family protein [Couchioplanes caeruleus]